MTTVTEQRTGDIAVLTLCRPQSLNAINQNLVDDLNAALDRVEASDARAFVLTGEGRAFCAGGDLKAKDDDSARRQRDMHQLGLRFRSFPKLSVAAVNGLARGGGFELAMFCTLRVASPAASFGLPEIHRSLMPGYGGTQLLPRLVGREHALSLLLTGDPIDAARAHQIGLVSSVDEDVVAAAVALAGRISNASALAQQTVLRAVEEGSELALAEAFALEAELTRMLASQPEAIAASKNFVAALGAGRRDAD